MRYSWILVLPLLVVGCATRRPPAAQSMPAVVEALPSTKIVETRYEMGSYRDPANPGVRHEAHSVFRQTRVPIASNAEADTISRTNYPPASYAPLPASAELAAELVTQMTITSELRKMQASMVETERQMQTQYATLVRQNAEVLKVREQLEAERTRPHPVPPNGLAAAPGPANSVNPSEVKW